MMTTRELRRKILLLLILCAFSLTGVFFIGSDAADKSKLDQDKKKRLEKSLRAKEQKLQAILDQVVSKQYQDNPFPVLHRELQPVLRQQEGLSVFLYQDDSLIYWSDNNVPAIKFLNEYIFSKPFIRYGNGWFRILNAKKENLLAVGMILVRHEYPYQNQYLVNDFQKNLEISPDIRIDTVAGTIAINSENGDFLFSLSADDTHKHSQETNLVAFFLWLLFFITLVFLVFYLYQSLVFFRERPFLLLLAFGIDAVLIRLAFLFFDIPGILTKTDLFGPFYFATSFISPSLGDLVINSSLWLILAWIFYSNCSLAPHNYRKNQKIFFSILMILFSAMLYYFLIKTMQQLVMDSNIEMNLNNVFNIDLYSGLGFLSMTALIMAYVLVSSRCLSLVCRSGISKWYYVAGTVATALLIILLFSGGSLIWPGIIYACLMIIYFLTFIYFADPVKGFNSITGILVYIVLFSMLATIVLDIFHDIKEKEKRKIIAGELVSKRDPLMEYEFLKISGELYLDSNFLRLLDTSDPETDAEALITEYLKENYFSNFRNNYDFFITLCDSEDLLNIQPEGYLENCFDYFNDLASGQGSEPVSKGFYSLTNRMGNSNYFADMGFPVPTETTSADSLRLFIEIYQKYISETGLGYPDLLIDQKVKMISGLSDYSYAKYIDGKLIYKNGDFFYSLGMNAFESNMESAYFIDYEGYNHLVTKTGEYNTLIISKKKLTFLDLAAPFSYLFILFSLFLLVFLLLHFISGGIRRIELNFSNQLQIAIISIIIISFFILGMITRANIIHLYNTKNRDNLSEKTFSVLTEIEHKLGNAPLISEDLKPYTAEILYKFSVVFYSDINLFDIQGNLIASSRPEIFNEGLLSTKINPEAYYKLTAEQRLLHIQNETAGKQEYLSAYIPFRNSDDRIIAYLNLPYFAKQAELRKEIGDFLAAYINVYVLLIVLAIMVTILVSRFISRPLQLIREKLSGIGLGKSNEKINWKRKDEIGNLIDEYNRMIDELARSAELLAKSERESAWREMAKQVAHEIKNPLTPMKLSVQYLQKAWDDKAPGWEDHLARFTRTIVEQIDSLSEIASEFSDFAKMPAPNNEKTGLLETIKSVAGLYGHHENISISTEADEHEHYVLADKRQLLRVFNNLVQNAVQAIGKKPGGMIRISIVRENDTYTISVIDNGTGITSEESEKIFSPSFTTKSSGMGLGLAMSKSILTAMNATIDFESKPGEGTTFRVRIPAWQK